MSLQGHSSERGLHKDLSLLVKFDDNSELLLSLLVKFDDNSEYKHLYLLNTIVLSFCPSDEMKRTEPNIDNLS